MPEKLGKSRTFNHETCDVSKAIKVTSISEATARRKLRVIRMADRIDRRRAKQPEKHRSRFGNGMRAAAASVLGLFAVGAADQAANAGTVAEFDTSSEYAASHTDTIGENEFMLRHVAAENADYFLSDDGTRTLYRSIGEGTREEPVPDLVGQGYYIRSFEISPDGLTMIVENQTLGENTLYTRASIGNTWAYSGTHPRDGSYEELTGEFVYVDYNPGTLSNDIYSDITGSAIPGADSGDNEAWPEAYADGLWFNIGDDVFVLDRDTLAVTSFGTFMWYASYDEERGRMYFTRSDGNLYYYELLASPVDADNDGHFSIASGGDDCDDNNAAINPGADEDCDDLTDLNCDGDTQAGAIDAADLYEDYDEDGWGGNVYLGPGCPGVGVSIFDSDCDDNDGLTYPGAAEICDAIANSCGPLPQNEADQDNDGVMGCEGDTADTDPEVYPGAPEIPCDGKDNNLDGQLSPGEGDPNGDGHAPCTTFSTTCDTAFGGDALEQTRLSIHNGDASCETFLLKASGADDLGTPARVELFEGEIGLRYDGGEGFYEGELFGTPNTDIGFESNDADPHEAFFGVPGEESNPGFWLGYYGSALRAYWESQLELITSTTVEPIIQAWKDLTGGRLETLADIDLGNPDAESTAAGGVIEIETDTGIITETPPGDDDDTTDDDDDTTDDDDDTTDDDDDTTDDDDSADDDTTEDDDDSADDDDDDCNCELADADTPSKAATAVAALLAMTGVLGRRRKEDIAASLQSAGSKIMNVLKG